MKKLICILLLLIVIPVCSGAYNGDVTVYVTRTGECYHRDGCSYLKSRIEMTLESAVDKGYRRCSRCKPPIFGEDSEYDEYSYGSYRNRNDRQKQNSQKVTAPTTSRAEPEKQEKNNNWKEYIVIAGYILFFSPIGWMLIGCFLEAVEKRKKKPALPPAQPVQQTEVKSLPLGNVCAYTPPHGTTQPRPSKRTYLPESDVSLVLKKKYTELYAGKSIWELACVPDWAYFDNRSLPHTLVCDGEQDPFIVYVTKNGSCYHRGNCRLAASAEPTNICLALRSKKCACKQCRPMEKLPDFVVHYQRLKQIQLEYGIDMLP